MKRSAPALISLLVGLAGCAALSGPYREYEIRFEDDSQPALGPSPSTEELINAAAWLIRHKLDMPFPPVIKAYVYVNQATLVDGLVNVAGNSVFGIGTSLRRVQTGHLRGYVLYLVLGAVALFALATYYVSLATAH